MGSILPSFSDQFSESEAGEMKRIQKIVPEDFLLGEPVPPEGIRRATAIMESGPLFRYSHSRPQDSEVSLLERDFARLMGTNFALAVNSCSSAIVLALRTVGAGIGTRVLVPSFTFTAVPSAIVNIGAIPLVVETNANYRVDLNDLEDKMKQEAQIFLLSHMRGNTSDMDAIMGLCQKYDVKVVEDAAHGLGCKWNGRLVGSFGEAGCFSFQSNKIVNAGEGGMLTTNDPKAMAQAVILSGAYERLHEKHFWSMELNEFFKRYRKLLPLYNMRMTEYAAALVRPQLPLIEDRGAIFRNN
ncbi:DegT/DnrJ/EryC1/StrS aminotransferase family protein [Nocardioides sp.]|uniref:DegT/DnrJ/EryC1/StrS family aminotransferase n=1 Tax=Nocardioides sp. TaxID=35761 RepID=UPI00273431CC|nr:aminotransferase class I/II-fold pyridoxal phosphate-dependent enzyme [Nocardioides sp.]MDP3891111.1 aminotransferase class I/II-fold pyridoxal phosphate-dependent enzyme [Nocardioides sp.]